MGGLNVTAVRTDIIPLFPKHGAVRKVEAIKQNKYTERLSHLAPNLPDTVLCIKRALLHVSLEESGRTWAVL